MMHGDKDLGQLFEPNNYLTRGFGVERRVEAAGNLRELVDAAVDVGIASFAEGWDRRSFGPSGCGQEYP